jgi:hypothetical protein
VPGSSREAEKSTRQRPRGSSPAYGPPARRLKSVETRPRVTRPLPGARKRAPHPNSTPRGTGTVTGRRAAVADGNGRRRPERDVAHKSPRPTNLP